MNGASSQGNWVATIKQKVSKNLHQPWFGGGFGSLLTIGVGLLLFWSSLGNFLRDLSYDLPFTVRSPLGDTNVVVVYLNPESYTFLQASPNNFDRTNYAQLLRLLKAEGVRMVVFDVFFDPTKHTDSDAVLAEAIRGSREVVLGGVYDPDEKDKRWPELAPLKVLRQATPTSNSWGLVTMYRDSDLSIRRMHPGSKDRPSLGWKAAELLGAEVTKDDAKRGEARWLNHYSKEPFTKIPFWKVIKGTSDAKAISFRDKVIFVGATGKMPGFPGQDKEEFRYPWTFLTKHFPAGVEFHAQTFANLKNGDWLIQMARVPEFILVVLFGLIVGFGLCSFHPISASLVALSSAILVCAGAFGMFAKFHIWFPWMILVAAQLPVAFGWSLLFNSIKAYVEKQLLTQSLNLYLSPHQVKRILKQPELLKPGGEERTVSILFSDIANFSKVSERLTPQDLVKLLNAYYEAAISCVHETEGTVMNLVGDAIFAIWNAPVEQEDHQELACRAAILLHEKLTHFNASQYSLPLRTRVGLHTGIVCVGNIGSTTRFDYTAIGESVNMASRLEGLNKQLETNLLASRDIQQAVQGRLVSRLAGFFRFKGLDQVVEVHEMIATLEKAQESELWRKAFADAWISFRDRSFKQAIDRFEKTLELRPEDGPAKFYIQKCHDFILHPPPKEWIGEIDLREK